MTPAPAPAPAPARAAGAGKLRLHWSPDSANLVIRIALEELGLPFVAVRVDRVRRQQKSAEYLRMNPQGLIPVLEDGDLVLFETGAILVHLADRTGRLGGDGPGCDVPRARAAFLKWVFWISNTLHADLRGAFYAERYGEAAAVPAIRRGFIARIGEHLALIERILAPTGWLAADRPTLADVYLAACLRWAQLYPLTDGPALGSITPPRTRALLTSLERRPAVARAIAAEHIPPPAFTAPCRPALPDTEITG